MVKCELLETTGFGSAPAGRRVFKLILSNDHLSTLDKDIEIIIKNPNELAGALQSLCILDDALNHP